MGHIKRKFRVFKALDGDWWWSYIKTVGGVKNIMATSGEGYKNKKDAIDGVREMQEGPSLATVEIEGD